MWKLCHNAVAVDSQVIKVSSVVLAEKDMLNLSFIFFFIVSWLSLCGTSLVRGLIICYLPLPCSSNSHSALLDIVILRLEC